MYWEKRHIHQPLVQGTQESVSLFLGQYTEGFEVLHRGLPCRMLKMKCTNQLRIRSPPRRPEKQKQGTNWYVPWLMLQSIAILKKLKRSGAIWWDKVAKSMSWVNWVYISPKPWIQKVAFGQLQFSQPQLLCAIWGYFTGLTEELLR